VGDYWILWTQFAEPAAVWLLSGTNWRCQQPRWGDDNDLAALPADRLEHGIRTGSLLLSYDLCEDVDYRELRALPLAGIRVEVRE
jgi:hypothetical protein